MNIKVASLSNKKTFYTDSNAMEMQERILDKRPTWDLEVNEHVAGNFYPVNSALAMRDERHGL